MNGENGDMRLTIVVEPRPDGMWARQKVGAARPASLHPTQAHAERVAIAQARREHAELIVKDADGQVVRRDDFTRSANGSH
jgi:hypothetical protein